MKEVEPKRVPSADWIRAKLGVSERFAKRMEDYCNSDSVNLAVKEYRKKKGLSEDIPLSQEIRDLLDSNSSIMKEITDSISSGTMIIERVLQVYKLEGDLYGISLFKVFGSLTPMKTYTSDQLGTGSLENTVHTIIDLLRKDPSLKLIVQRDVGKEINKMIIENSLKELELQEKVEGGKDE